MSKYATAEPDEWITPIRNGYKMACCDCGLVHNMDFRPVKLVYDRKKKAYRFYPIRGVDVMFRASRNERATYDRRKRHFNGRVKQK